jgi:phosphohistidine phosphatase
VETPSSYRERASCEVFVKRLYLLRHAKAEEGSPTRSDAERALTARGRHASEQIGELLGARDDPPEWVLCSPSTRTRETLARVLPRLSPAPHVLFEPSLYLASCAALLDRIRSLPDSVERALLVGHNPGIAELALRLARKGSDKQRARMARKFPTAALAILSLPAWSDAAAGGRLDEFVRPRELDAE